MNDHSFIFIVSPVNRATGASNGEVHVASLHADRSLRCRRSLSPAICSASSKRIHHRLLHVLAIDAARDQRFRRKCPTVNSRPFMIPAGRKIITRIITMPSPTS